MHLKRGGSGGALGGTPSGQTRKQLLPEWTGREAVGVDRASFKHCAGYFIPLNPHRSPERWARLFAICR